MAMNVSGDNPLILDGYNLTIENVVEISRRKRRVSIAPEAFERVERSHAVIMEAADDSKPRSKGARKIYGLTTGVGANKTQSINRSKANEFNRNMLRVHCLSVGDEFHEEVVRAAMAVRLSNLLIGTSGMQPALAARFMDFLNMGIHPVVRRQGSVGEADITMMSHIGLAMLGEGDVSFRGKRTSAADALTAAGMERLVPNYKDGLALVSSNGLSAGLAALLTYDLRKFADMADLVFSLSLEGIGGSMSYVDERGVRERKYDGLIESVRMTSRFLCGSSVLTALPDENQTYRSALSFSTAVHVHGALRDAVSFAELQLGIHLRSSEDHPSVLLNEGEVITTGNYESIIWAQCYELLAITMSHVSRISAYRITRLNTSSFSGLPDYLLPEEAAVHNMHGLAETEKIACALDAEIRHLANPASCDYYPLAASREDHANNTPYVLLKLRRILDNAFMIFGIEAIHASQAIDLRRQRFSVGLGKATGALFSMLRETIPFMASDRELWKDIGAAAELLKSFEIPRSRKHVGQRAERKKTGGRCE
jgi:histidine ammonia-lyase